MDSSSNNLRPGGVVLLPTANTGGLLEHWIDDVGLGRVVPIVEPSYVTRHGARNGWVVEEFSRPAALLSCVRTEVSRRQAAVVGVASPDDEDGFSVARTLAEAFQVPSVSETTAARCWNKLEMKRAFLREGVPTPPFQQIRRGELLPAPVALPCVLKIPTFNGSECVLLARDHEEYLEALEVMARALVAYDGDERLQRRSVGAGPSLDPGEHWLVEQWVEGTEYSCDFLVQRDTITVLRIARKYPAADFGYFRGFHLWGAPRFERFDQRASLEDCCRRVGRALGVGDPPVVCMLDFLVTRDGVVAIESSARPGMSVFVKLMSALGGRTSMGEWIRALLDPNFSPRYIGAEGLAVFLWARPGACFAGIENELPGNAQSRLLSLEAYVGAGEPIHETPLDHWAKVTGFALLKLEQRDSPEDLLATVERSVVCRTTPPVPP